MNCEDASTLLHAYLDDELGVAECLLVQQHLGNCAPCRLAEEEHLVIRSALRDPDLYAHPSPHFRKRIEAAVRRAARPEAERPRPIRWGIPGFHWNRWAPAAALVIAVIGVLFAIQSVRSSRQQVIASAVLASHIRSLQPGHLLDVPSSDRHTVKPWFQGKLDFSPPVPDLSGSGWDLDGGRLDYIGGRPVAALVYRRRMHKINVFLWPDRNVAAETVAQQEAQGYRILHWTHANLSYWVVSDLNQNELEEFARTLRERIAGNTQARLHVYLL